MRTTYLFFVFGLLSLCFLAMGQQKVPVNPDPEIFTQSDGSSLTIKRRGDNKKIITYTSDGYILVKNSSNIYEYAVYDSLGLMQPSGIKATDAEQRTPDIQTKIDFFKHRNDSVIKSRSSSTNRLKSSQAVQPSQSDTFPSSGKHKILLLLIRYPDLDSTYSRDTIQKMMNATGFAGSGSFHDFYLKNSHGKLNLQVDVYGWYLAKHKYAYYGENMGDNAARVLVQEAVDAAQAAGVDFQIYDNDNDGKVDNIMVIHSGRGAEENGDESYVWAHSWILDSYKRLYDNVIVNDYTIQPETRSYGMVGIGVFCHEFGHALGLPDLYDTNEISEGLGSWCLMSYGSWLNKERTPSCMSAWCKAKLGWETPSVIHSKGQFKLNPAVNDSLCYRINTQNSNEYFLLENRFKRSSDAYLPGSGLAIYHINTSQSDNSNVNKKLVDLEEADGLNELDKNANEGNAGDVFPGTSGNQYFYDSSNPNSLTYTGDATGIRISGIELADSVASFYFGSACLPPTSVSLASMTDTMATITVTKYLFADQFLYKYRQADQSEWSAETMQSATQLTFTSLKPLTTYEINFNTYCSDSLQSSNKLFKFTTQKGTLTESVAYVSELMSIYPNPSNGTFWVKLNTSDTEAGTFMIFDLYGKQWLNISITESVTPISIRLQPGIYIATFQNLNSHETKRIVIAN